MVCGGVVVAACVAVCVAVCVAMCCRPEYRVCLLETMINCLSHTHTHTHTHMNISVRMNPLIHIL